MKTSLDWNDIRIELARKIDRAGAENRATLLRILQNIEPLIRKLSIVEVDMRARRTGFRRHQELLDEIDQRIQELDQMITFASLIAR